MDQISFNNLKEKFASGEETLDTKTTNQPSDGVQESLSYQEAVSKATDSVSDFFQTCGL